MGNQALPSESGARVIPGPAIVAQGRCHREEEPRTARPSTRQEHRCRVAWARGEAGEKNSVDRGSGSGRTTSTSSRRRLRFKLTRINAASRRVCDLYTDPGKVRHIVHSNSGRHTGRWVGHEVPLWEGRSSPAIRSPLEEKGGRISAFRPFSSVSPLSNDWPCRGGSASPLAAVCVQHKTGLQS